MTPERAAVAATAAGTEQGPTMDASKRHRLRIRIKRYHYMLEALTDIFRAPDHGNFGDAHRSAKRLQRTLGDLRDLRRFGRASAAPSPPDDGKHGNNPPPGYRKRKKELLAAALAAYRSLKQASAY
jgi:hypothetical protein